MIEVSFIPTRKEYLHASKWATRHTLGALYGLWQLSSLCLILGFFYGLTKLTLASSDGPESLRGFIIIMAALYLLLVGSFVMRRVLTQRLYKDGGFFLTPHTIHADEHALTQRTHTQTLRFSWDHLSGPYQDADFIYLRHDAGMTLFIPKRIAATPEELDKLRQFFAEKISPAKEESKELAA